MEENELEDRGRSPSPLGDSSGSDGAGEAGGASSLPAGVTKGRANSLLELGKKKLVSAGSSRRSSQKVSLAETYPPPENPTSTITKSAMSSSTNYFFGESNPLVRQQQFTSSSSEKKKSVSTPEGPLGGVQRSLTGLEPATVTDSDLDQIPNPATPMVILSSAAKSVHSAARSVHSGSMRDEDDMDTLYAAARDNMKMREAQNVDEMKIQTMYKMVEEVQVTVQGMQVNKKVLYLTNKQACLFDEAAMLRCIQALDLGDPKFVIRLLPSLGNFSVDYYVHDECRKTNKDFNVGTTFNDNWECLYNRNELNSTDERTTDAQILLFMRTCVLPLAKQTKALILIGGANDCYLATALATLALQEQARLGKDCPFHVLACARQDETFYRTIYDPQSLSKQLCKDCVGWNVRIPAIRQYMHNSYGDDPNAIQHCDLTPAASHYIIFEGFDPETGKKNTAPKGAFEAILLQCLTRKLPSIAVQALYIDDGVAHLVELSQRGVPVLMLDCTERAMSVSRKVGEPKTTIAKESNHFPAISKDLAQRITQVGKDGELTIEGRSELLGIAFDMIRRKSETFVKAGRIDMYNTSRFAFLHSVLNIGGQPKQFSGGNKMPLWLRIREMEQSAKANRETAKNLVPSELASVAIEFLQAEVAKLNLNEAVSKVERWLEHHTEDMDHFVPEAKEYLAELLQLVENAKQTPEAGKDGCISPQSWLSMFDLFTAPNIFSGSIHDIDEIKVIMGSVAKIDRLPMENSLQALRTLQDCWDHSEVYDQIADSYKLITKVTYNLLLLIGIATTVFSLLGWEQGDVEYTRKAVIILSFVGTAVCSYTTFINPAVRWQQLRLAARMVESNIWLFRTRSGPYRIINEDEEAAERRLGSFLSELKQTVLEGADLKSTAFYSRVKSENKHGQHPSGKSGFGTLDAYVTDEPIHHHQVSLDVKSGAEKTQASSASKNDDCCCPSPTPNSSATAAGPGPIKTTTSQRPSLNYSSSYVNSGGGSGGGGGTGAGEDEVSLEDVVYAIRNGDQGDGDARDEDTHYQPVQPDFYIRNRAHVALVFYKERIPHYTRVKNVGQALLVGGSILSGAIAYFGYAKWSAMISIISAGITAYLEFSGVSSKITRYSATVNGLQELILWWQTLPQIDKSSVENIDKLVISCEDLLQKEQNAWKATSQSLRVQRDDSPEAARQSSEAGK